MTAVVTHDQYRNGRCAAPVARISAPDVQQEWKPGTTGPRRAHWPRRAHLSWIAGRSNWSALAATVARRAFRS